MAGAARPVDPDLFGIAVVTTDGVLREVGDTRFRFALGDIAVPLLAGAGSDGGPGGGEEADGLLARLERILGRRLEIEPSSPVPGPGAGHDDGSGGAEDRLRAMQVTAVDLAVLAATLAADGVQPLTGEGVVDPATVGAVMSAMTTGAMYGRGGEWMYRTGLPARSSRTGGVAAVLAGRAGVGVFSPRLDAQGRSVRGMRVCEELSRDQGARLPDDTGDDAGDDRPDLRIMTGTVAAGSSRVRNRAELERLAERASAVRVIEIGSRLTYRAVEGIGHVVADDDDVTHVLVDVANLSRVDRGAARLLHDVAGRCWARGTVLGFCGASGLALLEGLLPEGVERHTDRQRALGAVEARLLGSEAAEALDMADFELCDGMEPQDVAVLTELCRAQWFPAGALVCERDRDAADAYLIRRGTAEVLGRNGDQIAVHGRGTIVGEMALLTEQPRSAAVRAESDLDCYTLAPSSLRTFMSRRPHGAAVFMRNLARVLAERLRATTQAPAQR